MGAESFNVALTAARTLKPTTNEHALVGFRVPLAGTRSDPVGEGSPRRIAPLPRPTCVDCGAQISIGAKRCLSCVGQHRKTLPAPNANGMPWETRVVIGIGVWWPKRRVRSRGKGCWMCAHRVFIGGHVHASDGSRG